MTHSPHYKNEPTSAKKVSIFPQRMQEDPANQSQNCRGFEKPLTRCMSVLQLLSIHECLRRAGSCSPAWGGNSNNWWWREKRPLAKNKKNSRWGKENAQVFRFCKCLFLFTRNAGVQTHAWQTPVSAPEQMSQCPLAHLRLGGAPRAKTTPHVCPFYRAYR